MRTRRPLLLIYLAGLLWLIGWMAVDFQLYKLGAFLIAALLFAVRVKRYSEIKKQLYVAQKK